MAKVHATGWWTYQRGTTDGSNPITVRDPFDMVVEVDGIDAIDSAEALSAVRCAVSQIVWANNVGLRGTERGITLAGTPVILQEPTP